MIKINKSIYITIFLLFVCSFSLFSNNNEYGTYEKAYEINNLEWKDTEYIEFITDGNGAYTEYFYAKFTISKKSIVKLTHYQGNSPLPVLKKTCLYLRDSNKQLINSNCSPGKSTDPWTTISYSLEPGTYYAVSTVEFVNHPNSLFLKVECSRPDPTIDGSQTPVNLGTISKGNCLKQTYNTFNYKNTYLKSNPNYGDVYATIHVPEWTDLIINQNGRNSNSHNSYSYFLNTGSQLLQNFTHNNDNDNQCDMTSRNRITVSPGSYTIISETSDDVDYEINMSVSAAPTYYGDIIDEAIYLGYFNNSFNKTDSRHLFLYSPHYTTEKKDVFYTFTLAKPMELIISMEGSSVDSPQLHLLNVNEELIAGYFERTITYDTPSNDLSGVKSACERIILEDGFSFYAEDGKSLELIVDPNKCIANNDGTSNPSLLEVDIPQGQYYIVCSGNSTTTGKDLQLTVKGIYTPPENQAKEGENYVRTIIPMYTYSDHTQIENLSYTRASNTTVYIDGLGKTIQTVQRGITPEGKDIVSQVEHNSRGLEAKQWLPLPIAGNNGNLVKEKVQLRKDIKAYYSDRSPVLETLYESKESKRPVEIKQQGADWQNNPIKIEYGLVREQDGIINYYSEAGTLKKKGFYSNGWLHYTLTTDEDGNKSYEFKNIEGQIVLTRQMNGSDPHDTYYVYDDFGNLSYVIPPILSDEISKNGKSIADAGTEMLHYAYVYKYDERNRCIWKRLPGCEPIYYVYDKADRLIFSQDGEQRNVGQWTYTLYDDFGRLTVSGYWDWRRSTHDELRNGLKDKVIYCRRGENPNNNNDVASYAVDHCGYYTNLPNFGSDSSAYAFKLANYYDNYNLPQGMDRFFANSGMPSGFDKVYSSAKGLQTTSWEFTSEAGELATIMYYDEKGRMIKRISSNHLGGRDAEFIKYNFTGQPTYRLLVHGMLSEHDEVREEYWYSYDHAGRLIETNHSLDEATPVVLAKNEYDELGRLKTTKANNQDKLKVAYDYNIRSWMKSITTGNNFSESLAYTYSGNISDMETNNTISYTSSLGYDGLSRLKYRNCDIHGYNLKESNYDTSYSYDKHGNFKFIYRRFAKDDITGIMDDLEFNYTGNQIKTVHEWEDGVLGFLGSTNDAIQYTYDRNGALLTDKNKGMQIEYDRYNSFKTPYSIHVDNYFTKGHIYYRYSSSGKKLSSDYSWNNKQSSFPMGGATGAEGGYKTTQYVDNLIYDGDDIDPRLERVLIDNGYIDYTTKKYYFYLRDHLGNNRVVADLNGNVVQRTDYYPFGFPMDSSTGEEVQPYKYNGKEYETIAGINLYDYHARQHDPILGRFTSIDPLAEKYYAWSPYTYCLNNPMKYIDSDGKQVGLPMPNTTYWQHAVVNSQYPYGDSMGDKIADALYKSAPSAFGISIGLGVAAIVGVEVEASAVLTLKGNSAGNLETFATTTTSIEPDIKVGGGIKLKAIDTDNQLKFSPEFMEGSAKESSLSVSKGSISVSLSRSESNSSIGKIKTNSLGLSKEFSIKNFIPKGNTLVNLFKSVSGSIGESETKGFNTNSYKKDDKK